MPIRASSLGFTSANRSKQGPRTAAKLASVPSVPTSGLCTELCARSRHAVRGMEGCAAEALHTSTALDRVMSTKSAGIKKGRSTSPTSRDTRHRRTQQPCMMCQRLRPVPGQCIRVNTLHRLAEKLLVRRARAQRTMGCVSRMDIGVCLTVSRQYEVARGETFAMCSICGKVSQPLATPGLQRPAWTRRALDSVSHGETLADSFGRPT